MAVAPPRVTRLGGYGSPLAWAPGKGPTRGGRHPAAWGRWNSTRETFPAEYGWRAIFGEGPKTIFPPSPLLQPAGGRRAIAQSPPERPTGCRRAPFRESAMLAHERVSLRSLLPRVVFQALDFQIVARWGVEVARAAPCRRCGSSRPFGLSWDGGKGFT